MNAKKLLETMWLDYIKLNPLAQNISDLFEDQGEVIVNDHIALRTFAHDKTGIEVLAKQFLDSGYRANGEYYFEKKKLYAQHFEHPELPRVFISELLIDQLSENAQSIILRLIKEMPDSITSQDDFLFSGKHWSVSSSEYDLLLGESEYAAWMAAFGFRPNHFTVSINNLKNFDDVEDVNEFLKQNNIALNSSGGEVKGSEEDLLKQSSTLANKIEVEFSDGNRIIPSCYYEFAKRFADENGQLYTGFVAKSADKIFESTDQKQQK